MGHDHSHAPSVSHRGPLLFALVVTSVILIAEIVGSIITGSLALLIDAAHMLTEAGGLAMALVAAHLSQKPTTSKRTWGFARAEVLAATAQAVVLLGVGLYVFIEGAQRLFQPADIQSTEMIIFGVIGLVGNLVALTALLRGRAANFNMRAAFLEVLNDALGSVAVIAAAIVIAITGFTAADSIAAMLIGLLIVPRTIKLLMETVQVLLEGAPVGLDVDAVRTHLLAQDHVIGVHDLHATQVATGLPVLTAHIVLDDSCFLDGHAPQILDELQDCVADHFDIAIDHSTFQLETAGHSDHEHS
ncbi:MAG TPA: cation diffusion facilitator family transporter, partial [Glaciihabitans sp.]|nr:cation diffusion facilitator family transporter [Glaciihabitans sp.]